MIGVLLIGACEEPVQDPQPEPPREPEGEPAQEEERPRCSSDSDCVAVDVFCGGRSAEHRDVADEVHERYSREAMISNCERVPWAPPEQVQAFCVESICSLRVVRWPDWAACEDGDECAVVEDPCLGSTAVLASHLEDARATLGADERRDMCAHRGRPIQFESARCQRGFCEGTE